MIGYSAFSYLYRPLTGPALKRAVVRPRGGASTDLKRLASVVLLRPTTECGCRRAWRPHRSDVSRLDSLQADLLKSCFDCPAPSCFQLLLPAPGAGAAADVAVV
jgi:hypothetical protein